MYVYSLQKLLDVARQVNPNLYVVADLVTKSDKTENYFVNRLKINSVIKGELNANKPGVISGNNTCLAVSFLGCID